MNNEDLVSKFHALKQRHSELIAEKAKYEAKKEQLAVEIKSIQDKYPEYDLSTAESVNNVIATLTEKLESDLNRINEQYEKIKAV